MNAPANLRSGGLGGSDIGALLGFDPNRCDWHVWYEKTGRAPHFPATDRMLRGKRFERLIVDEFSDMTGLQTEWDDTTHQHPKRSWQIFTPDARIPSFGCGVDAKMVAADQRYTWGTGRCEVPEKYFLQCAWYMSALDCETYYVAALIGGSDFRIYQLDRDPLLERIMLERAEAFWHDHVLADVPPPIDGSASARAWLTLQHPKPILNVRSATPAEIATLEEYARFRNQQQAAKQQRDRLENQLRQAVGDAEGLTWPLGHFYWRATKASEETNWYELAQLELARHTPDERKTLLAEHTKSVPGSRRIHFSMKGIPEPEAEEVLA